MDEHRNGRECDRTVGDDGSFRAAAERPFSRLGEEVKLDTDRLARTGIGPVRLGQLTIGTTRELTREELGALLDLVGM